MKTILIVEDDVKIATALTIRLETAGYSVRTAPNGLEGIKIILEERPDLVVMDIWMPGGLGFSVAQRMKELRFDSIPFIIMTAFKEEGLQEMAQQLGAAAFFEKPFDFEDLLASISRALNSNPPAHSPHSIAPVTSHA